jgi:regulator of sirC expression with transglutaminase-like and TPR domain
MLSHQANGDKCKAMINETLKFSLAKLKEELKRSSSKTVVIKIDKNPKGVTYDF